MRESDRVDTAVATPRSRSDARPLEPSTRRRPTVQGEAAGRLVRRRFEFTEERGGATGAGSADWCARGRRRERGPGPRTGPAPPHEARCYDPDRARRPGPRGRHHEFGTGLFAGQEPPDMRPAGRVGTGEAQKSAWKLTLRDDVRAGIVEKSAPGK